MSRTHSIWLWSRRSGVRVPSLTLKESPAKAQFCALPMAGPRSKCPPICGRACMSRASKRVLSGTLTTWPGTPMCWRAAYLRLAGDPRRRATRVGAEGWAAIPEWQAARTRRSRDLATTHRPPTPDTACIGQGERAGSGRHGLEPRPTRSSYRAARRASRLSAAVPCNGWRVLSFVHGPCDGWLGGSACHVRYWRADRISMRIAPSSPHAADESVTPPGLAIRTQVSRRRVNVNARILRAGCRPPDLLAAALDLGSQRQWATRASSPRRERVATRSTALFADDCLCRLSAQRARSPSATREACTTRGVFVQGVA